MEDKMEWVRFSDGPADVQESQIEHAKDDRRLSLEHLGVVNAKGYFYDGTRAEFEMRHPTQKEPQAPAPGPEPKSEPPPKKNPSKMPRPPKVDLAALNPEAEDGLEKFPVQWPTKIWTAYGEMDAPGDPHMRALRLGQIALWNGLGHVFLAIKKLERKIAELEKQQ